MGTEKIEADGLKYLLGGRYTDILVGFAIVVEGGRGNENGDWFFDLMDEWMVVLCNEMVKYPN